MPTLRSDFLIHWTGKDINRYYETLCDGDREEYVNRLRDTLDEGLWMTKVEEELWEDRGVTLGYEIPMTCFTEIKLSLVREHTERYGCLGFGFSRSFIMERLGAPVFYVAGTDDDIVTKHFHRQIHELRALRKHGAVQAPKKAGVVQSLRQSDDIQSLRKSDDILAGLLNSVVNNVLFVKVMSECKCPHDFRYLDEAEWRILRTELKMREGLLTCTGNRHPEFKIPFKQSDLKVLILPDEKTRRKALNDADIQKRLFTADLPIIATVEECLNF